MASVASELAEEFAEFIGESFNAIEAERRDILAIDGAAIAYYASLGVTVTRAVTDNGSCCRAKALAKA